MLTLKVEINWTDQYIPGLANHQLKNKQMKNTFTIPLPLKLLVCTTIFGFTTSFCQNVNGHSKEKQLKSSERGKPERSREFRYG